MQPTDQAEIIYNELPNPLTAEGLAKAYAQGMLKKSELEDQAFYLGCCRNASQAQWLAKENCFKIIRTGHFPGDEYDDFLEHPEDDEGTDVFVAIKKIT